MPQVAQPINREAAANAGRPARGLWRSAKRLLRRYVGRERAIRWRLLRASLAPRSILAEMRADTFLISYPKCGRTWLRIMLSKALAEHFGVADIDYLDSNLLGMEGQGLPRVRISHDSAPHWKTPGQLPTSKRRYRKKKVLLLVRDPRDVVVSMYFERSRRELVYDGSLSEFLHEKKGSLDTIIEYYNVWARNRAVPRGFHLVRYEDLQRDAAAELMKIMEFLGLEGVSGEALRSAVDFASFKNMRAMEKKDALGSGRLRPRNEKDRESYKTRRGKVGGFVDYLSPEEIAWVNDRIAEKLDPLFGYDRAPEAPDAC